LGTSLSFALQRQNAITLLKHLVPSSPDLSDPVPGPSISANTCLSVSPPLSPLSLTSPAVPSPPLADEPPGGCSPSAPPTEAPPAHPTLSPARASCVPPTSPSIKKEKQKIFSSPPPSPRATSVDQKAYLADPPIGISASSSSILTGHLGSVLRSPGVSAARSTLPSFVDADDAPPPLPVTAAPPGRCPSG
jgi:hypothetical protein